MAKDLQEIKHGLTLQNANLDEYGTMLRTILRELMTLTSKK